MADILKSLVKDKKSDAISDEIISRVLEKHAENKGLESQTDELAATLDALHEMTGIPKQEIERIASQVQSEYADPERNPGSRSPWKSTALKSSGDLYFEDLRQKLEKGKRGFIYQLVPYLTINSVLVFLNIYSTSFPWSLFPVAFWGIGLVSHFLGAVYWPQKSIENKQQTLLNQLDQILTENSGFYRTSSDRAYFNGLYRMMVNRSSQGVLEEYLQNADPSLSQNEIKQISTQVVALQQEHLKISPSMDENWRDEIIASKREGRKYRRKRRC